MWKSQCCSNLTEDEQKTILAQHGFKSGTKLHVCSNEIFRLPLKTIQEVIDFLKDFTSNSHITWRVHKTNPKDMSAGVKNLFYKEFRCQSSNIRVSAATKKPHEKHTNCTAMMMVTLKKIIPRNRSRDLHMPEFPTIIRLKNRHNHILNCANNVRHKDVSENTKQKFLKLYQDGHSPASALNIHKMDLQVEYGEDYLKVANDRSLCPDSSWCYSFYHKAHKNELSFSTSTTPQDVKEENLCIEENEENINDDLLMTCDTYDEHYSYSPPEEQTAELQVDEERQDEIIKLHEAFTEVIAEKLKTEAGARMLKYFFKTFLDLKGSALEHALLNFGNESNQVYHHNK